MGLCRAKASQSRPASTAASSLAAPTAAFGEAQFQAEGWAGLGRTQSIASLIGDSRRAMSHVAERVLRLLLCTHAQAARSVLRYPRLTRQACSKPSRQNANFTSDGVRQSKPSRLHSIRFDMRGDPLSTPHGAAPARSDPHADETRSQGHEPTAPPRPPARHCCIGGP